MRAERDHGQPLQRAAAPRASCAFSAQMTSSQISTPGRATLAPAAVSASQPANVVAPKTMPIAIVAVHEQQRAQDDADVADVERRFRPAPPRRRSDAITSNTVAPKSVERGGASPDVGAGAARDMLIGERDAADRIARIVA